MSKDEAFELLKSKIGFSELADWINSTHQEVDGSWNCDYQVSDRLAEDLLGWIAEKISEETK